MIKSRLPITAQLFLLLLGVLMLNAGAFFFILQNVYQQELHSQAKTVVANVEAFGAWVSQSGRVWVKDGSQDFLSSEHVSAVESPATQYHFYSKNPALATREFSQVVADSSAEAKFRMTSDNVMNPSNAPNAFELRALAALKQQHVNDYAEVEGDFYRYASPLYHQASCIQCHGDPESAPEDVLQRYGNENGFGFKEGDLAGVISVTLPKKSLLKSTVSVFSLIILAVILLSIVPILWFLRRAVISPVKSLTALAEQISKGQTTDIDTNHIPLDSRNEIHQLMLATSRMRSSFSITLRKLKETRAHADKVTRYAKSLQKAAAKNSPPQ